MSLFSERHVFTDGMVRIVRDQVEDLERQFPPEVTQQIMDELAEQEEAIRWIGIQPGETRREVVRQRDALAEMAEQEGLIDHVVIQGFLRIMERAIELAPEE